MAANTLAYTLTELRSHVALEIGKNRTYSSVDSIGQGDVDKGIKMGLQQFYWPPNGHQWSFLQPTQTQLDLHAAYETGTISSSTTTVTLTGGTWPSWAAQGDIWADDLYHPVLTRTSDSQLVLVTAPATAFSTDTYSLHHRDYDLPDDFGGMLDPFTYRQDQSRSRPLTRVNEAMLRSMETYPRVPGVPEYFSLSSVAPVQTTSHQESKWRANFYPEPNAAFSLWYRYKVVPPLLDGTTNIYAHGGAEYALTLLMSCVDRVLFMLYMDDSKHQAFLEALAGSTQHDLRVNRPQTLGFGVFSDGYDRDCLTDTRRRSLVTHDLSNL